jgi:predicted phage terminase large subunit-like protein
MNLPDGVAEIRDTLLANEIAIQRELGRRSFYDFYKMAWPELDPAPFVDNWHIGLICDELQAAARREVLNLCIAIPPRHSKPVHEDEPVLTARGRISLREVVVGDFVLTHMGRFRRVEAVHIQGELPTLTVRAWSGRAARMAPDHPLLTARGWVQAQHLVAGDRAAVARIDEQCGQDTVSAEEARLLGYLVGDGSCTHSAINITALDETEIADIQACANTLGIGTSITRKTKTAAVKVGLLNDRLKNRCGAAHQLIDRAGLTGKNSYTKRAPPSIMAATQRIIAEFLAAYWACDGYIAKRGFLKDGRIRTDVCVGCDTVSRELALDVQHLLYRLGVNSRVRTKVAKIKTRKQGSDTYTSYSVSMTSADDVARFASAVTIPHAKQALLDRHKGRTDFDRPLWRDEIVAIEQSEPAPCRCLTVDEDQSFTAGDLVVHNSLLCSVAFPAWVWTWWPAARFITSSYDVVKLAMRDALAARRLVTSDWYQTRFPEVKLAADQNVKSFYQTTAGGARFACSPTAGLTGHGADFAMFDDPHNVTKGESEKDRDRARTFWFEAMSPRFNNPSHGVRIVVQQRVNEADVAGECIRRGYHTVVLPARFERDHPQRSPRDPRQVEGELLWPDKFSDADVTKLEKDMGQFAAAGQLQQRPVPREGGLFKRHWFEIVDAAPATQRRVRSWDLAASEKKVTSSDPDYTVGLLMSLCDGVYYIEDVRRDRLSPHGVELMITNTAKQDGKGVRIRFPQDPAQAGKFQVRYYVTQLAGWMLHIEQETGDKVTRADPFSSQAEVGNVKLVKGAWNEDFLSEIAIFPGGAHDDQVDAATGAFRALTSGTTGIIDFYRQQIAARDAARDAARGPGDGTR